MKVVQEAKKYLKNEVKPTLLALPNGHTEIRPLTSLKPLILALPPPQTGQRQDCHMVGDSPFEY